MKKMNRFVKLVIPFLFCLMPAFVHARIAKIEEARAVAENWIRFIVERDGHYGLIQPNN